MVWRLRQAQVMRLFFVLSVLGSICLAQFKSAVPLVVAPTLVSDSHGAFIDGLSAEDLVLFDNNVQQEIRMEFAEYPIDLVVAVQTSANSGAVIDKLGGSGILLTQLVAANAGETAMISFSDKVKVHQNFTPDPDAVNHAIRMLRKEGNNSHIVDALRQAQVMLAARPAGHRRVILIIAEKRDRGSETPLTQVMENVQRSNTAVYWLTYSPFLEPFTVKTKTAEDLRPEAERIKFRKCALCPGPDETPVPFDIGPGGYLYAIGELMRLSHPDLSALFTGTTGGRALNFLKKGALEQAIQSMGEEIHRRYIVTFQPASDVAGAFHSIRVAVKGRPELKASTRAGYWAIRKLMTAVKLYILAIGILLPYLARIPGTLLKDFDWLNSFLNVGLGGFVFLGLCNAVCWGSVLLAVSTYRHPRSAWFPAIFGFTLPALVYGSLDLRSSSTAAVALVFIPLFSLPLVIIGWLAGSSYDRKTSRSESAP